VRAKKRTKGIDNAAMELTVALVVDLRGESDIEQLRRVALAQQTQIELLVRSLKEALRNHPQALQQALLEVEERARKQQMSSDEAAPLPKEHEDKPRKKREQFGNTAQPKLPEVEHVCELDEPDKVCPCCGGTLTPMKDQFETSEMIDVVEISYHIKKVKQQKYVCRCGGTVETAPGPERAVPGSRYSLAFVISIAVAKYLDHIPLARQERMMTRCGLDVTTQTLWDLLNGLARQLEPVNAALLKSALTHPVIGLDQTGWKRLDGSGGKPWQIWCVTAPGIVVHRIKSDKSARTFVDLVGNYEGVIVCDAAQTHAAGVKGNDAIKLAGCWAHVYRKFEEAAPDHVEANIMVKWIQQLYAIDARAEGDLGRLAEFRRTQSAELLDEMQAWLWAQAPLETLSLGRAATYTLNNWERLKLFAGDVRIPLDNNATERGIRGPVVGRRNHFGSKSERGTQVAALFYTLMETAKLVGVNPSAYLREAVRAAARGEVLLPSAFQS
jgi:transposase